MNDFITTHGADGIGVFAKPMAPEKVVKKICKLTKAVKEASQDNIIMSPKLVIKHINKKLFKKGIVILKGDVTHLDIIAPIPMICEENKIPYIWVPNKEALVQGDSGFGWRICPSVYIIKGDNLESKWSDKFDELAKKITKLTPMYS